MITLEELETIYNNMNIFENLKYLYFQENNIYINHKLVYFRFKKKLIMKSNI